MTDTRVLGFVGVGRMGGPMASRLLDAGHQLVVFDTSADATAPMAARGARVAATAAEVASLAPIVFVSLPTPAIVQSVALSPGGIIDGTAVRIVVDVSTTGPGVAGAVAKALGERDITYVDSPVSGGIAGAVKGTLAVMVACPRGVYDELEPVLKTFGKTFFTGEKAGLAQTAKLANNLLAAAAMVVSSEAVVMGVKSGLDPKVMIDVINAGSGLNTASRDKFPKSVLPRTFDFGFATGLMVKDVRLCLEEAKSLGMSMEVAEAVGRLWEVVIREMGAESDFTSAIQPIEKAAGVVVGGKPA